MAATLQALHNMLMGGNDTTRSEVTLFDLDEKNEEVLADRARIFQYYPASLQDTKAVTWATKEIPGGSLPLYQWVSSGERQISFTACFSCDVDYGADLLKFQRNGDKFTSSTKDFFNTGGVTILKDGNPGETRFQRLKNVGEDWRNPNIVGALIWLRSFLLPRYGTSVQATGQTAGGARNFTASSSYTFAPRRLLLSMPNTGIGYLGGFSPSIQKDKMRAIMVGCDITVGAWFPSGVPKYAEVDLRFNQIAQFADYVEFPAAGFEMEARGHGAYFMPSRQKG